MENILNILPALIGLTVFWVMGRGFFRNSLKALKTYFTDESRPYELIPGTITEFSEGSLRRNGRSVPVFSPVFVYYWKGQRFRKKHAWKYGKYDWAQKRYVPNSKYAIGDQVEVRLYPSSPGRSRINNSDHFWHSRVIPNCLGVVFGAVFMGAGVYFFITSVISVFFQGG